MGSRALVAALAAIFAVNLFAASATAKAPAMYSKCSRLNVRYPHGVGRAGAHDVTRGNSPPVLTFTRNTRVYNLAIHYNKGLDRDHDGIACEQA
jgi:hypothetical protein